MVEASPGSSPRLRGTQLATSCRAARRRFIPAPAGNTPPGPRPSGARSVHPRACGEHSLPTRRLIVFFGSSPRLRGTPESESVRHRQLRFIPAPAGNTSACRRNTGMAPVHPRACGEHSTPGWQKTTQCGSSPRLRGTPVVGSFRWRPERFIPAPAGNTDSTGIPPSGTAVHPRACGEHWCAGQLNRSIIGSSPRLRGTLRPC